MGFLRSFYRMTRHHGIMFPSVASGGCKSIDDFRSDHSPQSMIPRRAFRDAASFGRFRLSAA
jgi:hypothetical protein